MIDILTTKGENYSFDPDTMRVYKNDTLIPSSEVEPVFSDSAIGEPEFSGLWIKSSNQIISKTGKITSPTDTDIIG